MICVKSHIDVVFIEGMPATRRHQSAVSSVKTYLKQSNVTHHKRSSSSSHQKKLLTLPLDMPWQAQYSVDRASCAS